jgi:hypothetical protein
MFGKRRRARHAEEPTVMPIQQTTRTRPTIPPISASYYTRARAHHTTTKAAITRLHVEHATLARLNNAVPAPRPRVLACPPIARAAAFAADRSTVVLPPAPRDALRHATPSALPAHEPPHGLPLGFPHSPGGPIMEW